MKFEVNDGMFAEAVTLVMAGLANMDRVPLEKDVMTAMIEIMAVALEDYVFDVSKFDLMEVYRKATQIQLNRARREGLIASGVIASPNA